MRTFMFPRKSQFQRNSRHERGSEVHRGSFFLKGSGGVTLAEIMAGIVIFGILIAMSLPALRKYMSTQQVEGAVNRLTVDLRLARQRATAESNNYKVSFSLATNSYSILDDNNNNSTADAGEMVLGPITIPAELTVTNGPFAPFPGDTLVFYPSGIASNSGEVTISNSKGFSRMLSVVRSTGAVVVR